MAKKLKPEKISVSLPFGIGNLEWTIDEAEQRAAWSLYIELITRIAVQPLAEDEGLAREALNSLYVIFATTREILKDAGPEVGASIKSVGGIAIAVLNRGLRPFLSKWHPILQTWETQREEKVSPKEHEKLWTQEKEFREALEVLRKELTQYADVLAIAAGVKESNEELGGW